VRRCLSSVSLGLLLLLQHPARAADEPPEYQVKAVFIFNFSHFVEWPAQSLGAPGDPFVIGVLGSDPFGARLDEAVRNERIEAHPLVVRRFRTANELSACQILFIDRSEAARLGTILAALGHRPVLTVSEIGAAAQDGAIIQFAMESNRIRLRINVESARLAGLMISSKLLRLADIVGTNSTD
jgi:hypothetical protein